VYSRQKFLGSKIFAECNFCRIASELASWSQAGARRRNLFLFVEFFLESVYTQKSKIFGVLKISDFHDFTTLLYRSQV